MAKLLAHRDQPIPDLRTVCPEVSESLETIFKKMVAKKIEDRYQTMTDVIVDLERSTSGQTSSANVQQPTRLDLEDSALSFLKNIPVTPTIQKTRTKAKPKAVAATEDKTEQPVWKNTRVLIGAAVLGVLLLLAGIVISLQTDDGTLIVTVDQPNAMVQVLDTEGKVEVSQKGGAGKITISVDPGKHRLKVEKDGFAVFGQEFEMESGGEKTIAATLAPVEVAEIADSSTPPLAKAPFDAAQAKAHQEVWAKHLGTQVETTNSVGMKMVLIPPGEFMMGSTDEQVEEALKVAEEINAPADAKKRMQTSERPQHRVVISKPLLMGTTEVTVSQFKKFSATGYQTEAEKAAEPKTYLNPGYPVTEDLPAAFISWNDSVAYCKWLSEQEQVTYRLPTEAEWEHACRAGTQTQYPFGDDVALLDQYGWYDKNSGVKSHSVGTKQPNSFGLHDMHGNLYEWCGDFYDEKWYEKSSSNDPKGSGFGSNPVVRGGYFNFNASYCRSAARHTSTQSSRNNGSGFRCVREFDATPRTASVTPQPAVPAAAPGKAITDLNSPEFQTWVKQVQAMPAEQQVEAVSKKLMELNPGFDGILTGPTGRNGKFKASPTVENGLVTEIRLTTDKVTDISPVRALAELKFLDCVGSGNNRGELSDLSPLKGMTLTELNCFNNKVTDLSPLRDMPLKTLRCDYSPLTDLKPLQYCTSLKALDVSHTKVTPASVAALQEALPNCKIECDDPAKATTTNKPITDFKSPAFQQWMKDVAAMPAEQQVEAVSKKLMELNPGFDGKLGAQAGPFEIRGTPTVENGMVTHLVFFTDKVTDISPVRGLSGLKSLECMGCDFKGILTDISPLQGMQLTTLDLRGNRELSDISPLLGMPLTRLICFDLRSLSDLKPLQGMALTQLSIRSTAIIDLSPLHGMPLTFLDCVTKSVSDLSPLQGMKLTRFESKSP